MRKSEAADPELLAEWTKHRCEIVSRYAGLVHATACRTCGDDSLATEATQLTFILLARKAKSLGQCPSLAGWLHRAAIWQTKNLIRQTHRENHKRQQLAMETQSHPHHDTWREMQPVLDAALAALSDKDREALLLRFYRSLTVREIAETLGIATDAAQKRIDRATERLRGKLLKRGCQSGGTLAATLLAGFTADAQAALPASILASKAIAAGAVGSNASSTLAILMTASKSTAPFVLVLAGLLGWVGTQRMSIASLEKEISTLRAGISEHESEAATTATVRKISRPVKVFHADQPIDWKEVAEYLDEPKGDRQWLSQLEEKLRSMTPEELIVEMDRIAALFSYHPALEQMVLRPLIKKDPEKPLRHLIGRLDGWTNSLSIPLIHAMQVWAKRDLAKATAWFDEQAASGAFDGKRLNDRSLLDRFHGAVIGVMISQDREAAALRFAMVPEKNRNDLISLNISFWAEEIRDHAAYASFIRETMPERDRLWPIAAFAEAIPYENVGDYLDAIDATLDERMESAGKAAEMRIQNISAEEAITRSEIDSIREWAGKVAPRAVGKVTGVALARSTDINTALSFGEAAELALEYHAETKDDDVLVGFLDSYAGYSNKAAGRVIAKNIIDPVRRKNLRHCSPDR